MILKERTKIIKLAEVSEMTETKNSIPDHFVTCEIF